MGDRTYAVDQAAGRLTGEWAGKLGLAAGIPVVEVHLSNPHARETFRHISLISGAAVGVVLGFGPAGYELALRGLMGVLSRDQA